MSDLINRIYGDFNKKNEMQKVKIPKFATGGICNDVISTKLDVFSHIDEIVKDIRDRQDNAMAMEFTKCIGEFLRKNGVVPKVTEYTHENVRENSIEHRYGVSIDELDFSEHDKVFEDKIARLEENAGYYKDSISRVKKNCDKLYHENQELKQRIAELEEKNKNLVDTINKLQLEKAHIDCDLYDANQRIAELESKNEQLKYDIDKMAESNSKWIDRAVEWQQKCEKLESKKRKRPCFVSYVGVEEINGKEYVSMEKFATAMEELNAYLDGFFDRTDEDTMQEDIMRKWGI